MNGDDEIVLPNEAYLYAEQAARDVTESNAAEYGRAGMHVGARWGACAALENVLADLEVTAGPDHPATVHVRERIARLRADGHPVRGYADRETGDVLRQAHRAAERLDPALGLALRELFAALYVQAGEGWGWSFGLRHAARDAASAVVRAAATPRGAA